MPATTTPPTVPATTTPPTVPATTTPPTVPATTTPSRVPKPRVRKKGTVITKPTGRTCTFRPTYAIDFGLKPQQGRMPVDASKTADITSARCQFCFVFGRECANEDGKTWKRKAVTTVHYFYALYRPSNFKPHLQCHSTKWSEYKALQSVEEKAAIFDLQSQEPYANTINAHFECTTTPKVLYFHEDVVDKIIGNMLFDISDDDDNGIDQGTRYVDIQKE